MSLGFVIAIIIALVIAGFVLWAGRAIVAVIPLEPVIKQVIDVLILILAVAIVIFYVAIPLLEQLGAIHIPAPR